MLAVRFEEDDLTVSNGPPSVPFGNDLFRRTHTLYHPGHAFRVLWWGIAFGLTVLHCCMTRLRGGDGRQHYSKDR